MLDFLQNLWAVVLELVSNFVSGFGYLFREEYYSNLFEQYFSVWGFIIGLILVLIIYNANPDSSDHPVKGFIRVLALVAVINSCYRVAMMLCDMTGTRYFLAGTSVYFGDDLVAQFLAPDNIISGLLLTMTASNDLRRKPKCAVMLGLACYAVLPMLRYTIFQITYSMGFGEMEEMMSIYLILRAVVTMILCWIMCYRKHFFTAWIWYFVVHMAMRLVWFYLVDEVMGQSMYGSLTDYLSGLTVDYGVFLLALLVGIFFEKGVLTGKKKRASA